MQKQPSSVPNLHDLTAQTLPPRTRSVLVLEDDVAFAEMLSLFLESHSFEVFCVPNGVEGLRKVTERDFDVIVCDLSMPNLPGDMFYLAVERVRKHLTKRFVFMTGYASDPKWAVFLSKVKGPVLQKPFALEELVSTIQTLLTAIELGGE